MGLSLIKRLLNIIFILIFMVDLIYSQNFNQEVIKGLQYSDDKSYENAIIHFTKALEINSSSAEVYFHRGRAKFEIKDFYGAIKDLSMCIQLDSVAQEYIFMSYYTLALSEFNIGKYKESINHFDSALVLNPKNSDILVERGKAKINLGNIEGGCEDFSKAGELGSKTAYDFMQQYCISSILYEDDKQWIKFTETIYFNGYYDPDFKLLSNNVYELLTKVVLKDSNYEEAKAAILMNLNTPEYKNCKFFINKYSIDIGKVMLRIEEMNFFNRDNSHIQKIILKTAYDYMEVDGWNKPNSNMDQVLIEVVSRGIK